jgi:hypothetical protein
MLLDVFVFFLGGWLMFAPHIPLIKDHLLLPYEALRVLERLVVQSCCHGQTSISSS